MWLLTHFCLLGAVVVCVNGGSDGGSSSETIVRTKKKKALPTRQKLPSIDKRYIHGRLDAQNDGNSTKVSTFQSMAKSRIIGGSDAVDGRFAYGQVSLQLPNTNHQCSASLVAPDIILTAAHCKGWFDRVQVNRHNFADPNDEYSSYSYLQMRIHPDFVESQYRYDFALIQLDRPVTDVKPVRIASNIESDNLQDGQELSMVGWGAILKDSDIGTVYPKVLQVAHVKYKNNNDCSMTEIAGRRPYSDEIYPEMLCAGDDGVDACLGDSGAPLVLKGASAEFDVQVGIVSWGRGCAVLPGVFSRISYVYDWIKENICEMSADPPSSFDCGLTEVAPAQETSVYSGVTPSTLSPTPSPTRVLEESILGNTSAENTYEETSNGTSTLPLELYGAQPSVSNLNTTGVVLELQLDDDSLETGWYIATNTGEKVAERAQGYYTTKSTMVREVLQLLDNVVYFLIVTDGGNNGIWGGSYRLYVPVVMGSTSEGTGSILEADIVVGSGVFGNVVQRVFFLNDSVVQQALKNVVSTNYTPVVEGTGVTDNSENVTATVSAPPLVGPGMVVTTLTNSTPTMADTVANNNEQPTVINGTVSDRIDVAAAQQAGSGAIAASMTLAMTCILTTIYMTLL